MTGDFLESRIMAQNHFEISKFLTQQRKGVIKIVEENNFQKKLLGTLDAQELVEVIINNVPCDRLKSPRFSSSTLTINMEHKGMPFEQPPGCKAVETAIIIIRDRCMHVFLCEMKSGLYFKDSSKSGIGENGVYKKFKDSLTRFSTFLPIFSNDSCNVEKIRFYGIVFFNHESVAKLLKDSESRRIVQNMALYQAFNLRNTSSNQIFIEDHYGYPHPIKVAFIQNNTGGDSMNIDFSVIASMVGFS